MKTNTEGGMLSAAAYELGVRERLRALNDATLAWVAAGKPAGMLPENFLEIAGELVIDAQTLLVALERERVAHAKTRDALNFERSGKGAWVHPSATVRARHFDGGRSLLVLDTTGRGPWHVFAKVGPTLGGDDAATALAQRETYLGELPTEEAGKAVADGYATDAGWFAPAPVAQNCASAPAPAARPRPPLAPPDGQPYFHGHYREHADGHIVRDGDAESGEARALDVLWEHPADAQASHYIGTLLLADGAGKVHVWQDYKRRGFCAARMRRPPMDVRSYPCGPHLEDLARALRAEAS